MPNTRDMTGKGAVLTLFLDGAKQDPVDAESWSAKAVGDAIADGVCGEDRDRLDFELRHWAVTLRCYNANGSKFKKILVDYYASLDNRSPQDVSIGLSLTDKKNGKTVLAVSEGSIDDAELAVGGMTERVMINIPMRFRYLKNV